MSTSQQACPVYKQCGGCPQYEFSASQERHHKSQPVRDWLSSHAIEYTPMIHSFPWLGFRDRCDLQYDSGKLGLYKKQSNEVVSITHCPKVHPLLNKAILWIVNNPPPIEKVSFLLRRSPDNTIGMWIDTSNINIATLLTEDSWITKAQEVFVVELGQRHKRLKRKENGWGLEKHPVLYPWFETSLTHEESGFLYSTIGSFTQPSMQSNKTLVHTVREIVEQSKATHWLEYGCGTGNFTFMLSQHAQKINLIEVHPISKKGLNRGLEDISTKAQIQFVHPSISTLNFQAALLDPPRSGMGTSIQDFLTHSTCNEIIYVSCNFQSMKTDMEHLLDAGYSLSSITGVDQFPKSNHCEWVAHLVRKTL